MIGTQIFSYGQVKVAVSMNFHDYFKDEDIDWDFVLVEANNVGCRHFDEDDIIIVPDGLRETFYKTLQYFIVSSLPSIIYKTFQRLPTYLTTLSLSFSIKDKICFWRTFDDCLQFYFLKNQQHLLANELVQCIATVIGQ